MCNHLITVVLSQKAFGKPFVKSYVSVRVIKSFCSFTFGLKRTNADERWGNAFCWFYGRIGNTEMQGQVWQHTHMTNEDAIAVHALLYLTVRETHLDVVNTGITQCHSFT